MKLNTMSLSLKKKKLKQKSLERESSPIFPFSSPHTITHRDTTHSILPSLFLPSFPSFLLHLPHTHTTSPLDSLPLLYFPFIFFSFSFSIFLSHETHNTQTQCILFPNLPLHLRLLMCEVKLLFYFILLCFYY